MERLEVDHCSLEMVITLLKRGLKDLHFTCLLFTKPLKTLDELMS